MVWGWRRAHRLLALAQPGVSPLRIYVRETRTTTQELLALSNKVETSSESVKTDAKPKLQALRDQSAKLNAQLGEANRYVRGMIHWLGFRQIGIPYERRGRTKGVTKANLLFLIGFTFNAYAGVAQIDIDDAGSFCLRLAAPGSSNLRYAIGDFIGK